LTRKYLFISNSNKPTKEQHESRKKVKLGNVRIPCVEAALSLGYEIYVGLNRSYAEDLECENKYDIKFYNQNIYRSVLDFKNNYVAYKNLMTLLNKEKFDVIHCNTPIGGFLGRICGKKTGVNKILYTAHGFHFYKGAPLINRTIFKWVEMWLAKYTDAIITMNEEDYQAAQKFKLRNNGKVYYVPGVGVDTEMYQLKDVSSDELRNSLGLSSEDVVLISMGDLIDRKNYATSIKAIAKANNEKLHFLICGKGPNLDVLKKIVSDLGVEEQIHFLGFRTDIKELLTIADIFLFTTYQEGLPRSMMEAMSAGLPCIASKIRGNVDLIQEGIGGLLRHPDDLEGFGEAINLLASDKELREKMKASNLETIKKFDVENVKKEMKKIYEQIL
jgi:glycosyltransferase involved in cell wall biosynthesis